MKLRNNIVFLDFDGPIIPGRSWAINPGAIMKTADQLAGALINHVLKEFDVKIVISSTWRRDGLDVCKEVLTDAKIDITRIHEDWKTPIGDKREEAILEWVENHKDEVINWVAIDDARMKLDPKNYLQVSYRDGFLYNDYDRLREKFLGE